MAEQKIKKWHVLIAMITNISMIFIDSTVLPVALPTIQRELGVSELGLQWLINAYLLSLSVFLIAGGRLCDILGRRRVCGFGLAIFSISSVLCAFSHSEAWFVIARAIQGIGGALLLPATSSIILSTFPPHERGRAMGYYLSAGSVFLAMGPLIGGLLTQYVSWRDVFWLNLPVSALSLLLLYLYVPKSEKNDEKFDLVGFFTLAGGITALVIAMMETPSWGWSWAVWLLLFLGVLLIAALITIDRTVPHPFIDFSIFRNKQFSAAASCIFLIQFLMMVTVFWAIFFQHILGYSPSVAGTITLIANSPIMFIAPIAGHLTDRLGPRIPAMVGFSLIFFGLIWFIQVADKNSFLLLLPGLICYGSGIPLVLNPCFVSSMNEISPRKWGIASGMRQTIRQLGGTFGMAIIGSLFLHREFHVLRKSFETDPVTSNLDPVQFEGLLSSTPDAIEALRELPVATAGAVKEIFFHSFVKAFHMINYLSALLAIFGFCLAYFLLSSHGKRSSEERTP